MWREVNNNLKKQPPPLFARPYRMGSSSLAIASSALNTLGPSSRTPLWRNSFVTHTRAPAMPSPVAFERSKST